jgi:hypothetical protein
VNFEFLFTPLEHLDESIGGLFEGAPLLLALVLAVLLGLRHASDPDHLVAVTSLTAGQDSGPRDAARLGAWWGIGHALTLVLIGIPLIVFKTELPAWLESAAEKAIGVLIIALAVRVIWKWAKGDYRVGRHVHEDEGSHRHLYEGDGDHAHPPRTPHQAFGIGALHGLAGTGTVVLLLVAALPTQLEAALSLAVFAPASVASMAACTAAFTWVLKHPIVEPAYRSVLIPAFGAFGVMFGCWYAGIL